ncbi:hypothetical protein JOD44_001752 [Salimicrobium jeotgali]|uniref:hypothetical protein n=1 Tax=Salimicrobium jeotgali TaxID=1230341 RepID=UPI0012E290AC|nr:hypothetical protein [Salimicrobium jeotgali]MBM7696635.1 hypothetical protein [Salimicrobium jeotgali]
MFATYNRPFQRITFAEGYRDYGNGGQWVEGGENPPIESQGIIMPLGNDDLTFDTSGTYTVEDRKLFLQEPETLDKDDLVRVDGDDFHVTGDKAWQQYGGFNVYLLKRSDAGGESA